MFGSDIYLGLAFLASADNPSDDGARSRDIRLPSKALPAWFFRWHVATPPLFEAWLARQPVKLWPSVFGSPLLLKWSTSSLGWPARRRGLLCPP